MNTNRRNFLKLGGAALGASTLPFLKMLPAQAAGEDVIVAVMGQTINSLDLHRTGTNRPSYQVAVNVYDRLVSFGTKTAEDGNLSYDYSVIEPEIAESWEETKEALIFKLKPSGKFHDGTPITAADVKWSFDRALALGGFPAVQMKAGSLEDPKQFVVIDDLTFKINLIRPSKLTLPDLAVPIPMVINSKVALANTTTEDPWATEYLHKTPAGSGAFMVERWDPGQQLVYTRNENYTSGPVPAIKRVIVREVPSPATRRALLERGDVNLSFNMPNKDAKELSGVDGLNIQTTPIENSIYSLCPNLAFEPFKDKRVRQAIAWSVPYQEVFDAGAYGRGKPMWGGTSSKPEDIAWPQKFPYSTDLDKARDLLKEAGMSGGFDVPLSISLGQAEWMEPVALLVQENLAKIGVNATIDKIPSAGWRTASLVEKRLPLHLETFGGWLNYPCYYFFWCFLEGHLFNSSNYRNEEIEVLTNETLHMAIDDPDYAPKIQRMIEIIWDELPRIALWQPALNVGMSEVKDFEYWFHRQLDVRSLKKV